jgi:glycerol dehydrogenase-like iron-containing ADH family enzyme
MTARKQRLTVTVDPELIEAGNRAVASGDADSVSGWVSSALAEKAERDRKLQALGAAIADYEAEFGQITAEEMETQRRADREHAVVVRGRGSSATGRAGRAGKARPA